MAYTVNTFCFMATALDGKYRERPLQNFLQFRDRFLSHSRFGRVVIKAYYVLSPGAAKILIRFPAFRRTTKSTLLLLSKVL
ncbi:CFI-box-CTERM domain-containing protein [Mesorhizobium sp. M0598]|uniref:CFI-box-CTERM domain-containing protein n=1 Tax=Mesorhizobium sp. M0598 TaxID=2956968 RepID=UPI00333C6BE7